MKLAADFVFFTSAMAGILFVNIIHGILIGVVLSLLLLIAHASKSPIRRLARDPNDGLYVDAGLHDRLEKVSRVLTLRLDGPLFFADAERFKETMYDMIDSGARAARSDRTRCRLDLAHRHGRRRCLDRPRYRAPDKRSLRFAVARVQPPVWQLWERAGLASVVFDGRYFDTVHAAVDALGSLRIRATDAMRDAEKQRDAACGPLSLPNADSTRHARRPRSVRVRSRLSSARRVPLRSGPPVARCDFTFMAGGLTGAWTGVVAVLLQGATLIAALSAAQVPRGLVRLAALVTVVALVIAAAAPTSGPEPNGFAALLSALLVGLAPIAIVWSIVRRRRIDVQTVLGALCIYVLLGMFWAFAFEAIGAVGWTPSSRRKVVRRALLPLPRTSP